jgi:hypothetical protein
LQRDPRGALDDLARFLDIAPFPPLAPQVVNRLPYDKPMTATAAAFLERAFAGEIDMLESMLGWDLSDWRRPVETTP